MTKIPLVGHDSGAPLGSGRSPRRDSVCDTTATEIRCSARSMSLGSEAIMLDALRP
jgi:hypothetical protein